jgi:hypothetical protein
MNNRSHVSGLLGRKSRGGFSPERYRLYEDLVARAFASERCLTKLYKWWIMEMLKLGLWDKARASGLRFSGYGWVALWRVLEIQPTGLHSLE